ncbi:MAG: hypothetical protein RML10_07990 [Geminocystis sp.]|nr:hypothetical protein [Geminocystis sp.]
MGGGINNNGTLVVERSIISGNRAEDNAGGISNSGTLTIRNSAIINNIAYAGASEVIEGGGGGILNGAGGNLIVVNTTISGNRTASPEQLDENGLPIGPGDGGGGAPEQGKGSYHQFHHCEQLCPGGFGGVLRNYRGKHYSVQHNCSP